MSETNLIPNDNFEVEAVPTPTPVMTVNSEKPDDKGNVDVEGSGGTSNYERLTNRPKINGSTLSGNQTAEDLGLADSADIDDLQSQIDAITSATDVRDVVADHAALEEYDTSTLFDNDVVKVLEDETHSNAVAHYRWVITEGEGEWVFIGVLGPFYTKSETDNLLNNKQSIISDLSDIRSGAEKGTTSVQTVNGEEPDASGNVDVSITTDKTLEVPDRPADGKVVGDRLGRYHNLLVPYDSIESPKWNCINQLTDESYQSPHGNIELWIDEQESSVADSIVIYFIAGANLTISIRNYYGYPIMWANDDEPTFIEGKAYEIVLTPFDNYTLASYTYATIPEEGGGI